MSASRGAPTAAPPPLHPPEPPAPALTADKSFPRELALRVPQKHPFAPAAQRGWGGGNGLFLIAECPQNIALPTAATRDFLSKHFLTRWALYRSAEAAAAAAGAFASRRDRGVGRLKTQPQPPTAPAAVPPQCRRGGWHSQPRTRRPRPPTPRSGSRRPAPLPGHSSLFGSAGY